MNELIKIEEREGKQTVNGRDLWEFLEIKKDYSDWVKDQINRGMFDETVDYITFPLKVELSDKSWSNKKEYYFTLDSGKQIGMMSMTEKGKEIRKYFIECELKLKERPKLSLEEMTKLVISGMDERIKLLENKVTEDAPKVEFFEAVTGSKDCIDIGEAAKVLNIKNFGRNKLFEFLREQKVLNNKNQPMQKYIDIGCFRTIEQSYQTQDGATHINIKTVVYQSGLSYIKTLVNRMGNICQ